MAMRFSVILRRQSHLLLRRAVLVTRSVPRHGFAMSTFSRDARRRGRREQEGVAISGSFFPPTPQTHMPRNQRYPYLACQRAYGIIVVLVSPGKRKFPRLGKASWSRGRGTQVSRPVRCKAVDQQLALSACPPFDSRLRLAASYLLATFSFHVFCLSSELLGAPWLPSYFERYDVRRERHDGAPSYAAGFHPPLRNTPPVPADLRTIARR